MAKFGAGKHLTAFMLDWTSDYVGAAKGVADGTWKPEVRWDGLAAGVVKMAPYNEAIPADVQAKLKQLEADIGSRQGPPLCRRAQGPGRQRRASPAGLGACRQRHPRHELVRRRHDRQARLIARPIGLSRAARRTSSSALRWLRLVQTLQPHRQDPTMIPRLELRNISQALSRRRRQ